MVAVPSIGRATQVTPRRAAPEADATRDLYERYARQIYAYCHHQLGSREEAEDAMQSTFLNAFRGFKRGVDPEFESAWLYKIAQNVCLTRQRSSFRRRRIEAPGDLDSMQDVLPSPEADADELIGLPQALEGLPAQQRRALLLREWQGLSYKEIAEELDLSQAAVETLLFRARRSLAAGLSDDPTLTKRVVGKLRAGSDAGSLVALLQTMLSFGGAKVAATVATVAATSVVAATPSARHAVETLVTPVGPPAASSGAHVHKAPRHVAVARHTARTAQIASATTVAPSAAHTVVHLRHAPRPAAHTTQAHLRVAHAPRATPAAAVTAPPVSAPPAAPPVDIAPPAATAPADTPTVAPQAQQPAPADHQVDPRPAATDSAAAAPTPTPTTTPASRRKDGGVDRGIPTDRPAADPTAYVHPAWQSEQPTSGRGGSRTAPPGEPSDSTSAAAQTAPVAAPSPPAPTPPTLPAQPDSQSAGGDPAAAPAPPPQQPEQGHRRH